jgi:uncharacterized protein YndB with AHSA1/START domain
MKPIVVSTRINAPPERVFEAFTDLRNAAGRVRAIKSLTVLTDGPIAKGTRFRETRVMFGKEATETMEITEFDPPRSYQVEARSCGMHYVSRLDFAPDAGATVARMTFQGTPLTLVAKIMGKVMAGMMHKACVKAMQQDFDDLRAYVESQGA